ncbi:beta-galactosidase [Meridianimarinicoccus sp. RP-17]|uniref:beta-galactosidase n=1 Tax=Meridianimarinicoccus zhengii TaxID=2056810 RepID=UPI000DACF52B|nr:beta-galactosidase [Phycocomes zhengii]
MKRGLGVCYYPEHWPEDLWPEDARRMVEAGLTWVRIGEFAWSRLEPEPGRFDWGWLDRAIDVLGGAGLRIVLGTPTATPPRWMLDKHPEMLACDANGHPRKFGSRRHYCFAHDGYLEEARRISRIVADRYGRNPHIAAWQTDNEYGCHDTVLSWSPAARDAFRRWLADRYGTINTLNAAWGNVFWSMEYAAFDQIDLPNLTVTEPNPAHSLAFRRFASEMVVRFNRAQVDELRPRTDAPILHNYMGRETAFDHYDVGADLDIATWDSYPLGFLEDRVGATPERQRAYARQGDPDFQAFHHDLYRAVAECAPGDGPPRWWVIEQQPGPVNWAPVNPAPLPGMVRLWTWEAFAHGAEAVCYFRWRQAPFAQEQMHAGLLRPDSAPAPGLAEARQVAEELRDAPDVSIGRAQVALVFDYDADRAWQVQPHGAGLTYFQLVFEHYRALRRAAVDIDIVPPRAAAMRDRALIVAPGLMHMPDALKDALSNAADAGTEVWLGPRSGARDGDFTIPVPLPPAMPGLNVTVARVETMRADLPVPLDGGGAVVGYREEIEGAADTVLQAMDGTPVAVRSGRLTYMAGWGDDAALDRLVADLCARAGIGTVELPEGLRCRSAGDTRFWFNHTGAEVVGPAGAVPAAGVLRESPS